ncbi:MAG: hypothetical protein IPI73_02305 [Betaproteobacteria bacterium]|nr:hypothetical protein [Betaproteobacteria bacterium]
MGREIPLRSPGNVDPPISKGAAHADQRHPRPDGGHPVHGAGVGRHRRAGGKRRRGAVPGNPRRLQETGAVAACRPRWAQRPARATRWWRPARQCSGARADDVNRGNDVLGQIFGSKDVSRAVAQNAAAQSGLDSSLLKKMLPMLAMLVAG